MHILERKNMLKFGLIAQKYGYVVIFLLEIEINTYKQLEISCSNQTISSIITRPAANQNRPSIG